jgi:hypothetical protein
MSSKDTLERAYGHIAKEPNFNLDFGIPTRGIRYYWHRLVRFFTR